MVNVGIRAFVGEDALGRRVSLLLFISELMSCSVSEATVKTGGVKMLKSITLVTCFTL